MFNLTDDQLKDITLSSFSTKPYLVTNPRNLRVATLDQIFVTIFNFGGRKQFEQLESKLGIKKLSSIFRKLDNQPNTPMLPMTSNYLRLYFDKHAPI